MLTDRLKQLEERYIEVSSLMGKPEIATDIKKVTELAKEFSKLEKPVLKFREYRTLLDSLDDLKEMAKDKDLEIREMAEMELESSREKIAKLEEEL
ncbi:MAG: PCRF domain-containing protein, partial [Candidatus Izemoplasmatales bacterium]